MATLSERLRVGKTVTDLELDKLYPTSMSLPSVGTPAASLLEGATALLERFIASVSASSEAPTRLKSAYGRTATDEVLQARDLADLSDRLDALSGDAEFWASEAPAPPPGTTVPGAIRSTTLDKPSLLRTLGHTAFQRCQEGQDAWIGIAHILTQWAEPIRKFRETQLPASPKAAPKKDVVELLYDDKTPLVVRRELARVMFGFAAAMTIARAEERGQKLPPWLALALGEEFAKLPERLLSNMRSDHIPTLVAGLMSAVEDDARLPPCR